MKLIKIIFFPFILWYHSWKTLLIYMPGNFGIRLRYILYKRKFKSCGKRVYIDVGVHFQGMEHIHLGSDIHIDKNCIIHTSSKLCGNQHKTENSFFTGKAGEIKIGDQTHIVQNCILMGYGGIEIGPKCTISAGSKIYSQSNLPYNPDNRSEVVSIMPYETAHFILGPVTLKENVWVGLNCVLMPGTHIDKNSFVTSYSLIKSKFDENSYISGNPAVKIRNRFD